MRGASVGPLHRLRTHWRAMKCASGCATRLLRHRAKVGADRECASGLCSRANLLARLAVGLPVVVLVAGCGLSLAPKPAPNPSAPVVSAEGTALYIGLAQDHGNLLFPPAKLTCDVGSRSVVVSGAFGVDTVTLSLTGLAAGRKLTFTPTASSISTEASLAVTGPFFPATYVAGAQQGGLVGVGTLAAAKTLEAGQVNLQLQGPPSSIPATVRGTWNCLTPSSGPPRTSEPPPTLILATAAPMVGECAASLQHQPSEAVTPLTCPDGSVNVLAWDYLIRYNYEVQALGSTPSLGELEGAFCSKYQVQATPEPVAIDLYQIAAAYYGWHFFANPSTIVSGASC